MSAAWFCATVGALLYWLQVENVKLSDDSAFSELPLQTSEGMLCSMASATATAPTSTSVRLMASVACAV